LNAGSAFCEAEDNGGNVRPVPDELTVGELLKKCSERPPDDAAWQEFVRRYHMTIKSFVMRTYHQKARIDPDRRVQFPEDMIEDLVQGVYIKLVEDQNSALERFEGEHENSIFKYLGMISMNVVRDHFREVMAQKRPRITVSLDQLLMRGDRALSDERAIGVENKFSAESDIAFAEEEIEQALKKVVKGRNRERDILIFKLRFYEEMTLSEIAKTLGLDLSPVSVGSILNRIVLKIKPILARPRGIRL
jgi:RNA polymerase sigma factor (sigma-70 family)